MRNFHKRRVGLFILALAIVPQTGSQEVWAASGTGPIVVEGQVFAGGLDAENRAARAVPRRLDPAAPIGYQMKLEPLLEAQMLTKGEPPKGMGVPLRIGTHRELPPELQVEMGGRDLEWEPGRDGGEVAVFSVTSPGARALRLALDVQRLPRGSELRFYSPQAPRAKGGVFDDRFLVSERQADAAGEPFWSPVVHGDTAVVEIWVPAWSRADDVRLSLREVSHIHTSLADKDLRHLGRSGNCNRDVQCFSKWTMAGNAVAKIVFEVTGGSALCTGQLTANENGDPLFLTAAHCISSRREAGSAVFFWFFERASCGGPDPTAVVQTGGGGRLLFTSASRSAGLVTDHTLMLLRRDPPAGATLLGWVVGEDPEDNVREKIHAVHHPAGDAKKASRGKVQDVWQLLPSGSLAAADPPTHYQVGWKKGTTEPGSSGGSILIGRRWPNQFMIGVLTGGLASCNDRREPDFYGMFEETFRRFKKFRKHFD